MFEELLFIVRSKLTVLSHPFMSEYKLVYRPVAVYVTPSQSKLSHAVTVIVLEELLLIVRFNTDTESQPLLVDNWHDCKGTFVSYMAPFIVPSFPYDDWS